MGKGHSDGQYQAGVIAPIFHNLSLRECPVPGRAQPHACGIVRNVCSETRPGSARAPVARSSAATPARSSLVLVGKFLLPFFVAHFAAEFTVEPALVRPLAGVLDASQIQ